MKVEYVLCESVWKEHQAEPVWEDTPVCCPGGPGSSEAYLLGGGASEESSEKDFPMRWKGASLDRLNLTRRSW